MLLFIAHLGRRPQITQITPIRKKAATKSRSRKQNQRARRPLPSALCPSALCPLPSAFCLLHSAFCPLPSALCLLHSAFCPLPSSPCPLPSAPLPSALCPLPSAFCLFRIGVICVICGCLLPISPAFRVKRRNIEMFRATLRNSFISAIK